MIYFTPTHGSGYFVIIVKLKKKANSVIKRIIYLFFQVFVQTLKLHP